MRPNGYPIQSATVSVVVLYYKDKANIENCIKSVLAQDYSLTEFIVVDNNSGDGLCSGLKDKYPNIKFIEVPTNEGFCGGNNIGLAEASGEFVFFLNSDVILEPNYIGIVMRVFQSHPDVALVSGKILRFDRATIDSTGLFVTRNLTLADRGADRPDRWPGRLLISTR
jgi:GT2 family glycosyltransferase